MPHSKFKHRIHLVKGGEGKCDVCGQTFKYKSDRGIKMKIWMHTKFCDGAKYGTLRHAKESYDVKRP